MSIDNLPADRITPSEKHVPNQTDAERAVAGKPNFPARLRRLAVTAGLTLMIVAAMVGLTAPTSSAKSGDWGHTPGTSLYGCTNPSVCSRGAQAVGAGWIQVWCWTDSYWQKWFKVRAWTGRSWNEGWVPTVRVDIQPQVPRC